MKTEPNAPVSTTFSDTGRPHTIGLTKREYFAAMALQGMLSSSQSPSLEVDANLAVAAADALIAQLNETSND